jgi:hypothetical protein
MQPNPDEQKNFQKGAAALERAETRCANPACGKVVLAKRCGYYDPQRKLAYHIGCRPPVESKLTPTEQALWDRVWSSRYEREQLAGANHEDAEHAADEAAMQAVNELREQGHGF